MTLKTWKRHGRRWKRPDQLSSFFKRPEMGAGSADDGSRKTGGRQLLITPFCPLGKMRCEALFARNPPGLMGPFSGQGSRGRAQSGAVAVLVRGRSALGSARNPHHTGGGAKFYQITLFRSGIFQRRPQTSVVLGDFEGFLHLVMG